MESTERRNNLKLLSKSWSGLCIRSDIMSDGNPCDDEVEEEDVPQSDRQSLTLVQATNMARSSRFSSVTK